MAWPPFAPLLAGESAQQLRFRRELRVSVHHGDSHRRHEFLNLGDASSDRIHRGSLARSVRVDSHRCCSLSPAYACCVRALPLPALRTAARGRINSLQLSEMMAQRCTEELYTDSPSLPCVLSGPPWMQQLEQLSNGTAANTRANTRASCCSYRCFWLLWLPVPLARLLWLPDRLLRLATLRG